MSNNLFSGIYSGLANTYSYINSKYEGGFTLENLNKAYSENTLGSNSLNTSFASYLYSNFGTIDKDGDGIISDTELNNLTNVMSKTGLGKDELSQLYASGASGLSEDTYNMVMSHFEEIDANGDGKVTAAEISSYQVGSAKQEKMDEYAHKKATNMSTFYGDDSSSSVDSYSMLSYRYKNVNK